jgi:hypothetical protein
MKILTSLLLFLTVLSPLQACAYEARIAQNVLIEVIADDGTVYPVYDVARSHRDARNVKRAYLEAINDKNYKIRARNLSSRRIGLVVAVDGRNIISGEKSNLQSTERMYILPAYGQATFDGWRTDQNQVHRFFITAAENSYAEAFGDKSAMGVIALAVFNEKQQKMERKQLRSRLNKSMGSLNESPALESEDSIARSDSSVARQAAPKAGTGFGEETYSPVTLVQFQANRNPVEKHFYKYEWREALCMKHIVNCGEPDNRFWSEGYYSKNSAGYGYALYPQDS